MRYTEAQNQAEREARRAKLRAEIRNCGNRIDNLENEIRSLGQKLELQREAKRKYEDMCVQIEREKEYKRGKVYDIERYNRNVKCLEGYQSRMYEFLSGQRASGNRQEIDSAMLIMQNEINTNEQKIEKMRMDIAVYNQEIDRLWRKMRGI